VAVSRKSSIDREVQALEQIRGEVIIAHQSAHAAAGRVPAGSDQMTLMSISAALTSWGERLQSLLGRLPAKSGAGEAARMGYGSARIAIVDDTPHGALDALRGQLGIAANYPAYVNLSEISGAARATLSGLPADLRRMQREVDAIIEHL
jgi:hypothetical protein